MDPRLSFIYARRSVRRYAPREIDADTIHSLLEAGFCAPSANDSQPCRFIVVTDREALNRLTEACIHYKMLPEAALAIAVCADPVRSPEYWVQDASAATENILLAAAAMELGAVWLGVHPREDRKKIIRSILHIPQEIEILSLVSVGHPIEPLEPRTRFEEGWVHHETWLPR